MCFAPAKAQITPSKGTIYLMCNALTTSYTYTQLRGDIAGCLSEAGYTMVYNADKADWSIQIFGATGKKKETQFGTTTWYFTEVTASRSSRSSLSSHSGLTLEAVRFLLSFVFSRRI